MIQKVYSIRDGKGEFYCPPFFAKTHGEAERSFHTLANDEKSQVNAYAEDFDLYHLGEFDNVTGKLMPLPTPTHIVKAVALKKPLALKN